MPRQRHAEAFCLMTYTCSHCGFSEVYWNSRDGVTPFITRCPKCSQPMRHVDWQKDTYAPNHIPEPGQGIWIDMPKSLRRPLAAYTVQSYDGSEFELEGEEREEMIQSIISSHHRSGEPWLIRWPGKAQGEDDAI